MPAECDRVEVTTGMAPPAFINYNARTGSAVSEVKPKPKPKQATHLMDHVRRDAPDLYDSIPTDTPKFLTVTGLDNANTNPGVLCVARPGSEKSLLTSNQAFPHTVSQLTIPSLTPTPKTPLLTV